MQIVRTSFVSGVHVFALYLALEWRLASILIFVVLSLLARHARDRTTEAQLR